MQVVGYDPAGDDDGPAALLVAEAGTVRREPLAPGRRLAYGLGERHCAGELAGPDHVPCEREAAPYCPDHADTWVCARCTGTCLKDEMDCLEEHAVYLAAFAPDTFKVGVTRRWRVARRLREQGADRGAVVAVVPDGRVAREMEAGIADGTVPDRVGVPAKVRGLHRSVDESAWADLLSGFDVVETYAFEYGLSLSVRPVAETVATGTVAGTKGRVLVLDRPGGTCAVDLRDLVGYEVTPGPGERDVQSNLGAFG